MCKSGKTNASGLHWPGCMVWIQRNKAGENTDHMYPHVSPLWNLKELWCSFLPDQSHLALCGLLFLQRKIPPGSDSDYRVPFSRSSKSHAGLCSFQQNQKQHKTTNISSSSTGLFRGTHFPRLLLAKHTYTQLIGKRTKHSNTKFAAGGQLDA